MMLAVLALAVAPQVSAHPVRAEAPATVEEPDGRPRTRPRGGRPKGAVDDAAVSRELARRFVSEGLEGADEYRRRLRLLESKVSAAALRERLADEAAPTLEEVAGETAEAERLAGTRRYRLENIFRRFPDAASPEDRARLREEMEALRRRALAGESFGALARQYSDSETRLLDGRLGTVVPGDLAPGVAEAVAALSEGTISPVLEQQSGLSLLRCAQVLGAEAVERAEVARNAEARLRRRRLTALWDATTARLLSDLEPVYDVAATRAAGGARTAIVISFRGGPGLDPLDVADLDAFLREDGQPFPGPGDPDEVVLRHLERRAALEAQASEAVRRGLFDAAPARAALERGTLELQARIVEEQEVERRVAPPTEAELRQLWEQRRETLRKPALRHVEVLELRIDRDVPAEVPERFRRLGLEAAAGRLAFEELERQMVGATRTRDLGWLDADGLFLLGPNADAALRDLPAGWATRVVQEGRWLKLFRVCDFRPERPLVLEEARPRLREALLIPRRRAAREAFREEVSRQIAPGPATESVQ